MHRGNRRFTTAGIIAFACAAVLGASVVAQAPGPLAALSDAAIAAPIVDGIAAVGSANTRRDRASGLIEVLLEPEPALVDRPVVDPAATDDTAGMLRRLHATGRAAGLAGVLYDNRDSGHSVFSPTRFPQLARTRYDDAFIAQGLHHGVAGRLIFPLPVVGNSSTALTRGPLARSLGRLALADQASALRSYRLFVSNHLYVYPEHRDYDPETGDRLLAHAPYFLLSQGSSYSDRPLIEAALSIIAALPPATRAEAEASGRLPATVQAVLRRTLAGVGSARDYLSPAAHPPVLDARRLRTTAAVSYAGSLAPDTLPPLVSLAVEQDFAARPGVDYLARNLSEVIFTTPMAVARAWRAFDHDRRVTLRATIDRPAEGAAAAVQFHWVLLQGDPDRVRIQPRDDGGNVVDIDLSWHDRFPVRQGQPMTTPRVDIAVIADAGGALSAPAVFSVLFPVHQMRSYATGPDGARVLERLRYDRPDGPQEYADPLIWPTAAWEDRLIRDPDGRIDRIERRTPDGKTSLLMATPAGWQHADGIVTHMAKSADGGVLELTGVQ